MRTKSCFIVGLPEACKTTFLAALWYSLCYPDKTKLSLVKFTGNHNYIAKLSETWLGAEKVSRTNIQSQEKILQLLLKDNNNQEFEVSFPDLSGESFQNQYKDREIDKDLAEYIKKSDGILLFINPDKIKEPNLIAQLDYEIRHDKLHEEEGKEELIERNPVQDDPDEVVLVELLQFLNYLKGSRIRLGVIISAWDTIEKKYDIPEKFIKEQLPLLWQYIISNSALFDIFFYGVSAQGGPLENNEDSKKLLSYENQMDRIIVVKQNGEKFHDITLPLWEALKEGELSDAN